MTLSHSGNADAEQFTNCGASPTRTIAEVITAFNILCSSNYTLLYKCVEVGIAMIWFETCPSLSCYFDDSIYVLSTFLSLNLFHLVILRKNMLFRLLFPKVCPSDLSAFLSTQLATLSSNHQFVAAPGWFPLRFLNDSS